MISPRLADEWELDSFYAESFDQREGLSCARCGINLRLMALASAILRTYHFPLPLAAFVFLNPHRRVLEINGSALSTYLRRMPRHQLVNFPDTSIEQLPFAADSFDLVVHTETLEHVDDPVLALTECRRVLKPGGRLAYTIPVVSDRLTRSRQGMPLSYHGQFGQPDYEVRREYGADFWNEVIEAGFTDLRIVMFKPPVAFGIVAR